LNAENEIVYKAPTISCLDDANIMLLAKKDKSIRLYKNAHTADERFKAWDETYAKEIHNDLVFSNDSVAYQIGVKPLRKKDLRDFSPDDKIVNRFEEILRHNNVSDKENAFNRLIALFICKLVDESTKAPNDEVEFQYRRGTDTYETLQDRLQRLHRDGMEKFMGEEIYYVSADYPEWLFATYTGAKRKKAIEDLQNTIKILKFYSNNDFAFKDVHNRELFYQNGKILVEMVQLFEKYRIIYPSKHQFLGDLFEQLLSKGFKQNEGQFFTPMPITRFMWDSLPVYRMIKSEHGDTYPKIIDYACGAGHFLTESVEAINYFADVGNDNAWVRDHVYGIEKDYRLARVAKISLFMNGAGEGNIIFGDGLENAPEKGIENGTFDILVANPPYAVKDFKQHLQLKNNSFILLDKIGMNGGEIETLFVERIGQLLKPRGVAAVILPSSILSNDSGSYMGARELLLENFYIRAIVALGSKTFGATSTNTVILFLEKFNEPPKRTDLLSDSVDSIMDRRDLTDWKDKDIIAEYMKQIEVPKATYSAFLNKSFSIDELEDSDYFKMYVAAFADSTDAKNLLKTKAYKKMTQVKQEQTYLKKLYEYINQIEREKLFYFALVYRQTTVIIKAPTDNKKQKEFLGYDWSNRKGNEGIQIIAPGGKMYNNVDREANDTLAHVIRDSFDEKIPVLADGQEQYGSVVHTRDMLEFSRATFNKAIRLNAEKPAEIVNRYQLKHLSDIATLYRGVTYSKADQRMNETSNIVLTSDSITPDGRLEVKKKIFIDESKTFPKDSLLKANDIFICMSSGSKNHVGKVAYIASNTNYYAGGFMGIIRISSSECLPKYLYYVLSSPKIRNILSNESSGSNINNLSGKIGYIKIPIPPLAVQKKIADECGKIDSEYKTARTNIKNWRKQIERLFDQLDIISRQTGHQISLADSDKFTVSIGKRVLKEELPSNGKIPVYSANVKEPIGFINDLLITDFSIPSVLWEIDGNWMTSYIPENERFYPTDHCGVLRCKTDDVNPRYLTHILKQEGTKIGFSRSYRASINRVKSISFSVADREVQDKTVSKIKVLESQIQQAEADLQKLNGKTSEILHRYLD